MLVAQSRPTLCDPKDCSPPGSSVHGILQARILEPVAMFSSRGSSQLRDRPTSPALQADSLPSEPPVQFSSVQSLSHVRLFATPCLQHARLPILKRNLVVMF